MYIRSSAQCSETFQLCAKCCNKVADFVQMENTFTILYNLYWKPIHFCPPGERHQVKAYFGHILDLASLFCLICVFLSHCSNSSVLNTTVTVCTFLYFNLNCLLLHIFPAAFCCCCIYFVFFEKTRI